MKKILLLLIVLVLGFGGIFALSRTVENTKPKLDEKYADEDLYFSGKQLNTIGHDFRGLIADWYWINSLQYLGNKVLSTENVNINDLRSLNPRLLYPMLDNASTLDPKFLTIYSFGATVLPAIDTGQAIKLLEKGIAANPDTWQLYHNLGYIYWQLKNYQKASELYAQGAKKPGAPDWMEQMSVNMQAQGGSREFALQIYKQMYDTAKDDQTKSFAELRYYQVLWLNERDAIRPVIEAFQKQNGRCINSWLEISPQLHAIRLKDNQTLHFTADQSSPVDPTKVPYYIINQDNKCDVAIDSRTSKIPLQ